MRLDLRQVALNLLAAVPRVRDPLRRVRDRHEATEPRALVERALESLETRRRFAGDERLRGAEILEIGSGKESCLALLLLAFGARRVVNVEVDSYGYLGDPALYRLLAEMAAARGWSMSWPPLGLVLEPGGDRVRPDGTRFALYMGRSAVALPEPDRSVDVTLSMAVLEHVRPADMARVAGELHRVTRPGGTGYHRVDLVDHYHRHDEPFRFLRFSRQEYRWMYGNRGSSSNRFRLDDLESTFRGAGFSQVRFEDVRPYPDAQRFARWAEGFHPDFRGRDPEMMRACECMMVVTR